MNAPKPPLPPHADSSADRPGDHEPSEASLLDELSPIEFDALRWSVRQSDGLDPDTRAEFDTWLNADPAHRAAYEDIAGVWDAINDIPPAGQAHIRASVAIDSAALSSVHGLSAAQPSTVAEPAITDGPALLAQPTPPSQTARPARARMMAAMTALAILGGGSWLGWNQWQNQPMFSQHYATQRGGLQNVALPDGSTLQLDTATQAEVALYRRQREVRLPEGQVFFKVQADASRPFNVLTGSARITVLGTQFSVRHTPSLGNQAVQIEVSEGRVRVASNGGSPLQREAIIITAGQALTVAADGKLGAVTPVATESVASWRNQRLNFDATPLAQVLAEIGRYVDPGIQVRDPSVANMPLTASLDLSKLNAFTQTLPQVLPVRLVRRENGLEIVRQQR